MAKYPYTSEADYNFHTPREWQDLRDWIETTRALDIGQTTMVGEIMYVMRKAGYSIDEVRRRFVYLMPRKV